MPFLLETIGLSRTAVRLEQSCVGIVPTYWETSRIGEAQVTKDHFHKLADLRKAKFILTSNVPSLSLRFPISIAWFSIKTKIRDG